MTKTIQVDLDDDEINRIVNEIVKTLQRLQDEEKLRKEKEDKDNG